MANNYILKTLIYSDVFDYPLTKEEIWKFLMNKKINKISFDKELKYVSGVGLKNTFYYLLGREEIVEKRNKRKEISQNKMKIARRIGKVLSFIPTVLFIGVSGGLALENSEDEDDIDLFVITAKGCLWVTRLLLVFSLVLMGQYRGRAQKKSQKICLNMLIDETSLSFSKDQQNLYLAHEIVQLRPMFNRNNTYNKFLNANKWVEKFMPNAMERIRNPHFAKASWGRHESRIMEKQKPLFIIHYSLFILENIAKIIQLWYMKGHRTREIISDHFLAFHPFDYGEFVSKEYNERLNKYEV